MLTLLERLCNFSDFYIGWHPAIQVAAKTTTLQSPPAAGGSTDRYFVRRRDPAIAFLKSIPSCAYSACVNPVYLLLFTEWSIHSSVVTVGVK